MKTKAEKIVKDLQKKLEKEKQITFFSVFDNPAIQSRRSVKHMEEKRVITFACSDGSLFVGQFIPAIEGGLLLEAIRVAT